VASHGAHSTPPCAEFDTDCPQRQCRDRTERSQCLLDGDSRDVGGNHANTPPSAGLAVGSWHRCSTSSTLDIRLLTTTQYWTHHAARAISRLEGDCADRRRRRRDWYANRTRNSHTGLSTADAPARTRSRFQRFRDRPPSAYQAARCACKHDTLPRCAALGNPDLDKLMSRSGLRSRFRFEKVRCTSWLNRIIRVAWVRRTHTAANVDAAAAAEQATSG
jgi:hypothetical protein